ncbi:MAG: AAA family ATPase [Myxococcales bacterium]|nr:AAA family ATPase [Myxococcales bacterium]
MRDLVVLVAERGQTFVLVSPVLVLPQEIEKDTAVLDLPLPNAALLDRALSVVASKQRVQLQDDVKEKAVRAALGLTLDQAQRIFRKVMLLRDGLEDEDLALVVEEKRRILGQNDAIEFCALRDGLRDVGGLGELKRWLRDRARAFGADAKQFGLPPPKGLLLLGVQGCGKSLSAKAVAELWKFPLLRLDLSAVFGAVASSPEATIRSAIKISESLAPVVLWVDEIEKGFSQVEGDEQGSRVFGSFLTWLAEKRAEVFVVATANNVRGLPPELLRRGRFDEVFFVDLPNAHERLEVLKIHLAKRGRDPDQFPSLKEISVASEHYSGAELEQVIISGLYRAFSAHRELVAEDLQVALRETVPLYATYEERIKELRDWAKRRARPATLDSSVLDLFGRA